MFGLHHRVKYKLILLNKLLSKEVENAMEMIDELKEISTETRVSKYYIILNIIKNNKY